MEDLVALPQPTRRTSAGLAPIGGATLGSGRETSRITATVTFKNRPAQEPDASGAAPPPADPGVSRETAILAEQRRLRRQLEASLKEQAVTGAATTEDTVVCQLCELLWADHACLWMLPPNKGEPNDWSRQTIVSEAVAEYYPLTGYSTATPAEPWARACLEPAAEGSTGFQFSGAPFNAPKEGEADPSSFSHYLLIPLRGRPGHGWLLLLERYGSAASPASPWTDFDQELLEDSAALLGMALENNLLSAQSAERASYLTNMLNSLDVAVMVIEQPPAPVPAVVSLVNRSFCELFGVENTDIEGGSYLNFMEMARHLLPDWEAQLRIIEDLLADPTAERIDEITLVTNAADAVPIHLHRFATPARDAQGHIFGRMFFFRDITYDKEVERQLVHSQKMDSIGTLAGGVAHDFNNLLTTILGYTELLKREFKENESSHQKLLQIEKSANRAAELTGQLLAFSRRHPTVLHVFNLNELVVETMDMIRSTVPTSIDVQFLPGDELPNIEADSTQIQQVLINLILNARDALSGAGKITISTRIGADTQAQAEVQDVDLRYAILEVEDNGVGIPKDVLHRIFEPFYTTKEVGKGTGLGLAMVYGIVKKHNGFIEVTSALGEGTKFSAFIPLTPKTSEDDRDVNEPGILRDPTRKLVVMVVDDEPDLRDFCVTALGEIASDILTAGNGVEALEQFENAGRKVDLILLDLTMPKMSGPECFQRLRALDPDVRVLISSGYSLDLDAENLLKGNASGFLPKPYDLNQLMESVDKALRNGKPHAA
jgi:signal transduction histidine kinase/ActR/RegA family two-component response regulator